MVFQGQADARDRAVTAMLPFWRARVSEVSGELQVSVATEAPGAERAGLASWASDATSVSRASWHARSSR